MAINRKTIDFFNGIGGKLPFARCQRQPLPIPILSTLNVHFRSAGHMVTGVWTRNGLGPSGIARLRRKWDCNL